MPEDRQDADTDVTIARCCTRTCSRAMFFSRHAMPKGAMPQGMPARRPPAHNARMTHPDSGPRVLRAQDYRRERWRNGGGWTREILRWPETGDWDLRLSIAEVDSESPFSRFDGIDRELVLLQGQGMQLRFDGEETRELAPPHGRCRFAGERDVVGVPIGGPTRDFNLMWRRSVFSAELLHRPLAGSMLLRPKTGQTWLLFVLAGRMHFDAADALPAPEPQDIVVLPGGPGRRFLLQGAGELLAIRLDALA